MASWIVERRWPLVVVRYPESPSIPEVRDFYREWDRHLARGPHGVLIDLSRCNPLALHAGVRKAAADEVEARRDTFERLLLAEARCVPNPMVRGVVTAFDWLVGSSFSRPLRNFSSYVQAEAWLENQLCAQPNVRLEAPL